jgi:tetratricopeptide (TPR) repeat protein
MISNNRRRSQKSSKRPRRVVRRAKALPVQQSTSLANVSVVLLIFGCAFLLRLIYLLQIDSIPLFFNLAGDGRTYDDWAQRIAAGDWLGVGVFYQAPLYPYFLGVIQLVLGHNLWSIRLLQIILGGFSCALLFVAGRNLFSYQAGIAAALLLASYAPAIFFDALIEKSILDLFFLSILLVLANRAMERPHWSEWFAIGAVLGFLGLSRENALVLAAVVPVWIGFYFSQESGQTRCRWAALFFCGLLLVLAPVGLRNLAVGGEFKLTTSQLGPNFFIGNNPAADGTYGSIAKNLGEPQLEGVDAARLAERDLGRKLTAGQVSDYWFEKSWSYIRSQPLAWLRLFATKWLLLWNRHEIEDSDDFYIYQQWSSLLSLLGSVNHFGLLAPLAAVGLWLTREQWRRLSLLYAMIVSLALSIAIFYVFGRYRFPLVPFLALFAGAAVIQLGSFYKGRAWQKLAVAGLIFIVTAMIANWPMHGFSGPGAAGYNNLSNAYYKQGKVDEAIKMALKAIALKPDYGVAHYNLGNLYAGQGRFDLAQSHFQTALRLYPNYADVWSNLGQLIAERGDLETGIQYFRRAIELKPALSRAHLNLGVALAKQGRIAEAVHPLEEAARLAPGSAEARFGLGSLYAAQQRYDEAVKWFDATLRIEPDHVAAHQSLAQLLALQGKKTEAIRHYQEAMRIMRKSGGSQKRH